MSKIDLYLHKTNLEKHTAETISNYLKQNKNKPVLFLVSGGSAFKVLDYIGSTLLRKNITLSLIDDCFSRDRNVSNFLQLMNTGFYKKAKKGGIRFVSSLPEEGQSLSTVSELWEKALCWWEQAYSSPNRVVVAIMGIGLDSHTAGIIPFPEDSNKFSDLFENKEKWIIGYNAGNKSQYPLRLTVTLSFLREIVDHTFVYVSGEIKKNILNIIMKSPVKVEKYPASVIHSMKYVELHTDIDIED